MNYEIFVVSLAGENARRNHVKSQFAQYDLEPEFVNAIDMRNTQPELLSNYHEVMRSNNVRELSASEVGCALSHLKIAQQVVERNLDFALVTEDDVCLLRNPKDVFIQMPEFLQQAAFDVAILGYVKVYREHLADYYHRMPMKTEAKFGDYIVGSPWKQKHCGAVAYILTQKGAHKLLRANSPVSYVADAWDEFVYRHDLRVKHIRPSIAIESLDFLSTNNNDKHRPVKKNRFSQMFHFLKCKCREVGMNYLHITPR